MRRLMMYLRITRGRFDPARYDELLPLSREVSAAVLALPGCQSIHTGLDRTAGRLGAVSTWDTVEHANYSREAAGALGDVVRRTQAIGVQLEPPEIYEIIT